MWFLLAMACVRPDDPVDSDVVVAAPCAPEVTAPAWVVEGETATLSVRCTGPDAYTATVEDLPADAAFDGTTVTWTTGLDDAGSYTFPVTLSPVDGGADELADLTLDVVDAAGAPGNVPPDPAAYVREFGLPVVHLVPDAGLTTEDVRGVVWIDGEVHVGEMKIRGASSSTYPKPGYSVNLDDDVDLDAWGLGDPDDLVLLTTFDDASYVRQKLAFDLWADMAAHQGAARLAPRTAFVVVYVSGEYRGLFVAADYVDHEFLADLGVDGTGPLYKAVNHDANFRLTNVYGDPKATPHDGYEQKEGIPGDWAALDALVVFAGGSDTPTFVAGMAGFIDPTEFMDWYLFVRFASAGDSGGKNAYVYAEPPTGRLRYVPWDMNHSFGQDWRTIRIPPTVEEDFRWTNQIFVHLQDDPSSRAALQARWDDLVTGPFGADALHARLDAYDAAIAPSVARDWARWGEEQRTFGRWAADRQGDFLDAEGERAYLRDWIDARAAWAATAGP